MKSVLLCGFFKSYASGNAWILDMHPEVFMTDELCAFYSSTFLNNRLRQCIKNNGKYLRDQGEAVSLDFDSFYEEYNRLVPISIDQFVKMVQKYKGESVSCLGEKLPAYLPGNQPCHDSPEVFRNLHKVGPVKVLCCIRDGRDVMCEQIKEWHSLPPIRRSHVEWAKRNVKLCIESPINWLHYMKSWDRLKASMESEWYEINYSAMVEDPGREGADIAEFLEVDVGLMAELYAKYFKPCNHLEWKRKIPDINKQLSREYLDMLEAHGF